MKRAPAPLRRTDSAKVHDGDEAEVSRWVAALRTLVYEGQVELVARVGDFLIEHVYGSVEAARSRVPFKPVSLDRLAARASEFGMTPTGVRTAVPIALQVRDLGRPLSARLGIGHHRALLPVRDAAEKRGLAEKAAGSRWSADELRVRVRKVQAPHPGGRPAAPALVRVVEAYARLGEGVDPSALREDLPRLGQVECRRLLNEVNRAQALLERLEKLLVRGVGRG